MSRNPINIAYWNMLNRCRNKNRHNYKNYGGRGITICDRWIGKFGYKNFLEDMGERPDKYELDRIDVNGNYEPKNCRWVDKYTQMGNTTATKIYPGVSWFKLRKKYRARIKVNKKEIHLGLFNTIEEAIESRKKSEKIYVPNNYCS